MLRGAALGLNCRILWSTFSQPKPGPWDQKAIFLCGRCPFGEAKPGCRATAVSASRSGGTRVRAGGVGVCPAGAQGNFGFGCQRACELVSLFPSSRTCSDLCLQHYKPK